MSLNSEKYRPWMLADTLFFAALVLKGNLTPAECVVKHMNEPCMGANYNGSLWEL